MGCDYEYEPYNHLAGACVYSLVKYVEYSPEGDEGEEKTGDDADGEVYNPSGNKAT